MTIEQYQKEVEHIGETRAIEDHDHDMVHELSRRIDALWRYDQYIANAKDYKDIKNFWEKIKSQELENIKELKEILKKHIKEACF